MKSQIRVDVTGSVDADGPLEMAATVTAPATRPDEPVTVAFGYPGGGYNRGYYNLDHPAIEGESQAEFHAARGWVFVAFDPLGVGDSSLPDPSILTVEALAAANHAGAKAVLSRIRDGSLLDGLGPTEVGTTVGVGHSLGGMELIAQQGWHGTFDAAAVLAFSAIHTVIPSAEGVIEVAGAEPGGAGTSLDEAWAGPLIDDPYQWRWAFFWDDVPDEVVKADLGAGFPERKAAILPPWASRTWPAAAVPSQSPGVVSAPAAMIDVPVLLITGQRDVVPDLRAEPAAYRNSPDIMIVQFPGLAHMHNFSRNRWLVWRRLHDWADVVAGRTLRTAQ